MANRYPPITEEEMEILAEFRTRISDMDLDEFERQPLQLIKWPRARNYDLDRAERMLRRSWEWRKSYDYDNILSWETPVYYDVYFPYEISGYDEYGCPVVIVPVCEWDPYVRRELMEGRKELVHRFLVQVTAKMMTDAKAKSNILEGKLITQCVIIFDLTGFNMRHLTSIAVPEVLLESFRNFERNFPESLAAAYVINAPSLFALLFPIVKKMLAAKTIGKVQLYDGNASKWKKALLSIISPSSLPMKYGGILPDRLQKRIEAAKVVAIDNGGLGMSGISIDALNTVTVSAGCKLSLDYDIKDSYRKISWIFKSDTHDIGFSITQLKNEVVPRRRTNADTVQEGSYMCPETGKYTVNFDNTYSLFRAKTLHYLITIEDSKYYENMVNENVE